MGGDGVSGVVWAGHGEGRCVFMKGWVDGWVYKRGLREVDRVSKHTFIRKFIHSYTFLFYPLPSSHLESNSIGGSSSNFLRLTTPIHTSVYILHNPQAKMQLTAILTTIALFASLGAASSQDMCRSAPVR